MLARLVFAIASALSLFALTRAADAAPMSTRMDDIRKRVKDVVIGKLESRPTADHKSELVLHVEKALRGSIAPGPLPVKSSPDGTVFGVDGRIVVFLDEGAVRWVGQLVAGPSLESGVIQLHGFFDLNAHIVDPGIVSLRDMLTAFDTGALVQKFAVTLAFDDGKGGVKPSTKRFEVEEKMFQPGDKGRSPATVRGLAVACMQPSSLFGLTWGRFSLSFHDTCHDFGHRRELDLEGTFVGLDGLTGAILVNATPRGALSETEYDTFARDPDIVAMRRVLRVSTPKAGTYSWRLGDGLYDAAVKRLPDGSMTVSSELKDGVQRATLSHTFGDVTISIETKDGVGGSTGGDARGLTTLVTSGTPYKCSLTKGAAPAEPCTLTMDKVYVQRAPKKR